MFKKLELYWGVKNPSFVWLQYVTQLNVQVLQSEVDALHKAFQSKRVPSYKESKNNKLPFMRRYALQSHRYFIVTSPRRLNEWPESFFEAFIRMIGETWVGSRPTIKEKAETIEKGLQRLWPESLRCYMVDFPENEESAFGMIMNVLPTLDTDTWRHIADAANIQSRYGDPWSENSIYVFGETGMQLTGEHTEIVTFVQWLVYCFYMLTVSDTEEQMIEAVKKDVVTKGSIIWHYPICHEKIFIGGRSRSFMDLSIGELVEAEGSSREK
jgi:hypothetical protein